MALYLTFLRCNFFLKHAIHLARKKPKSNIWPAQLQLDPVTQDLGSQTHKKCFISQIINHFFWVAPWYLKDLKNLHPAQTATQTNCRPVGGNIWAFVSVCWVECLESETIFGNPEVAERIPFGCLNLATGTWSFPFAHRFFVGALLQNLQTDPTSIISWEQTKRYDITHSRKARCEKHTWH